MRMRVRPCNETVIRGHVHMMSALGVGKGVPQKETRVLISSMSDSDKGRGAHFEDFLAFVGDVRVRTKLENRSCTHSLTSKESAHNDPRPMKSL